MTAALVWGEWSAACPGRTLPPGKVRYPFYRRLGGPQGRSGWAENLVPTGIRYWTVQPVVGRYTYWATRPTRFVCIVMIILRKNLYHCNSQSNPVMPRFHYHTSLSIPTQRLQQARQWNHHVSVQGLFTDSQNRLNWFTTVSTVKTSRINTVFTTLHKNQNNFGSNTTSLTNGMVMRIFFQRWRLVWWNGVRVSTCKSSFTPLCDGQCADFNEIHPFSDTLWRTPTLEFTKIWQAVELVIPDHERTDGRTDVVFKQSVLYLQGYSKWLSGF